MIAFEVLEITEEENLRWARVRLGELEASVRFGAELSVWEEAVRRFLASVEAARPELRPARMFPALFDLRRPPAKPTVQSILRALKLAPIPPQERLDAAAKRLEDVFAQPYARAPRRGSTREA